MAYALVFNANATDPAAALVRSVTNNQAAPRPIVVLGDNPEFNLFVSLGDGGYDPASGDATVTPWLGIGTPGGSPSGGTFWLGVSSATSGLLTSTKRYQIQTFVAGDDFTNLGAAENASGVIFTASGTTPTDWTNGSTVIEITTDVAFSATAATLEAALEATQAVTGVAVTKSGSAPVFVIDWDAVGAQSTLVGGPSNLTPASAVVTSELRAGSASVTERQLVRLTRQPYALQTTWSTTTNGWTARLDCNTRGLLELLDGAASVGSTLELQLVDGDGNIRTVGQTSCLIRNEAIDEESTIPAPFPAYPTTAQMLLDAVQNRYTVTALTGGGTALDGIVTGPTANQTVQTNSLVCIELATVLSFYELVTGTDAESSPSVIRPDDYASSTNERVWKLRATSDATKLPLAGGTMTGQINFSGTTHAGLKLLSLTTTQRDALTAANGMLIYNSTLAKAQQYEGGSWVNVGQRNYAEGTVFGTAPTSGAYTSATAIGSGAQANANYAVCISKDSVASGVSAAILGGQTHLASGQGATVLGGLENAATATASTASGQGALADIQAQSAHGASAGASQSGLFQKSSIPCSTTTTDATPTEVLANAAARLVLRANTIWKFTIDVAARRASGAGHATWKVEGTIYRNSTAGSATILGDIEYSPNSANAAGWDFVVSADTTNGALKMLATGGAYNVRWTAAVHLSEVTHA